jgi:hypothetical protein
LALSANQLRYGLPIMRTASTLFNSQEDIVGLKLVAFEAVPYLTEIRCLLDWMLSKTSLDVW